MSGKLVVGSAFVIEEMISLESFVTMGLVHIIITITITIIGILMGFLKISLQLE